VRMVGEVVRLDPYVDAGEPAAVSPAQENRQQFYRCKQPIRMFRGDSDDSAAAALIVCPSVQNNYVECNLSTKTTNSPRQSPKQHRGNCVQKTSAVALVHTC